MCSKVFERLLGMCSVTEAGEGEDGRMKSAIGIGALLMDGLGDTIRVSLTEDPEYEIEPCRWVITASPEVWQRHGTLKPGIVPSLCGFLDAIEAIHQPHCLVASNISRRFKPHGPPVYA